MMYEEFTHEITFQTLTRMPDGGGGYSEAWTNFLTTEAFVSPISSREFYLASQAQTPVDYNVLFPYVDGIKPSMRIKHGEKYLSIKSKPIDQGGQGEILLLKCELL